MIPLKKIPSKFNFSSFNNLLTLFNYSSAFFKTPRSFLPTEIQIEPSSVCNLRCTMCNLDKSNHKNRFLETESLRKFLDSNPQIKTINFTGMGESLLNPNLKNIINLACHKNIKTSLITNAQILNQKISEEILTSGLNKISISIETAIPRNYNQIRLGGSISTLKQNLKKFIALKKRLSSNIEVLFNVVLLDINLKNLKHITTIIDLAASLGINTITFQNTNILSKYIYNLYLNKPSVLLNKFNSIIRYSKKRKVNVFLPPTKIKAGSCYYPWIYPQITASGDLIPCCIIPQFGPYSKMISSFSWGNIYQNPFSSVFNSNKAKSFRKSLTKEAHPYCKSCTKYLGIL